MNNKKEIIQFGLGFFAMIGIITILFIGYTMFRNWNQLIGSSYVTGKDSLEVSKSSCINEFNKFKTLNPNAKCNEDFCVYRLRSDGKDYDARFVCGRLYVPK